MSQKIWGELPPNATRWLRVWGQTLFKNQKMFPNFHFKVSSLMFSYINMEKVWLMSND